MYLLLNTVPKSGSVFLRTAISRTVNANLVEIGNGFGFIDQINVRKLINLVESNSPVVCQGHFACDQINAQTLEYMNTKMVLHLRDPRQVLLSWIHHLDRITGKDVNSENVLYTFPRVPRNYFEFDLSTKIDWQIANFLPECNTWTSKWVDYAQDHQKNVLVTEYKGLRDPVFLLRKIFDFTGINTDEITIPSLGEATDVTHFRKGLEKEFLEVFSSSQLRRCNQIAPTDIYKRFGWL
jgi:predicted nuclease of restriction endonuclease-like (RecB) superfamily